MNKFKQLLLIAGLTTFACSVSATTIKGDIVFNGFLNSINTTTQFVDIKNDTVYVSATSGDFATVPTFDVNQVTYADFSYASPFSPIVPLWTAGDFTFSLNDISFVDDTNPGFLNLRGTGAFNGVDSNNVAYDETFGSWTFTETSTGSRFSFTTINAPEPSVALLLGIGLIGFGFARKARKTA